MKQGNVIKEFCFNWIEIQINLNIKSRMCVTWFTKKSQSEVNIVLLVSLSVGSVGVHVNYSLATYMEE